MNYSIIVLKASGDFHNGVLSFAEAERSIPFKIQRVYWIYNLSNLSTIRGRHAHREIEQVFFCLHGEVMIVLRDAEHAVAVVLNKPHKGLYIGPLVWMEMRGFKPQTVILALASGYYDEAEYIRDYDEFLSLAKLPFVPGK